MDRVTIKWAHAYELYESSEYGLPTLIVGRYSYMMTTIFYRNENKTNPVFVVSL